MSDRETIRDAILADIRLALKDAARDISVAPIDHDSVFTNQEENLVAGFIRSFTAIDGKVIRCEDELELAESLNSLVKRQKWTKVVDRQCLLERYNEQFTFEWTNAIVTDENLEQVQVGITDCECLIARTGTIVMSTAQTAGRTFPIYVPVHVVVARESQLVYDLDEAILEIERRYQKDYPSAWYLMSGPSRTGDIEKTLVLGVHGPIEVYVFLMK